MSDSNIIKARQRLAEKYDQVYHRNAILQGEWDRGSLIKAELKKLKEEAAND